MFWSEEDFLNLNSIYQSLKRDMPRRYNKTVVSRKKSSWALRPTLYNLDRCRQAYELARVGLEDTQIAVIMGVADTTMANWKREHPDFLDALLRGRVEATLEVQKALYKTAVGYTVEETQVVVWRGQVIEVPVKKHVLPTFNAQKFWLMNKDKTNWVDARHIDTTVKRELPTIDLAHMTDDELKALEGLEKARRKRLEAKRQLLTEEAQVVEEDASVDKKEQEDEKAA